MADPNLISVVGGWSTTWKEFLGGDWAVDHWNDLMGLDPAIDQAMIMTTNGKGAITQVKDERGLGPWTHVANAQFTASAAMDQLFYDAATGDTQLRISIGGAGQMQLAPRRQGMRKTWSLLTTVMTDPANKLHAVLFYEAATGIIEIQNVSIYGFFTPTLSREGAPKDWRSITSLDMPGGDTLLFCYTPPK